MAVDPVVEHLRFTVEQFERMGAAGVLDPDERYELLDGEVVPMPPIGPKHAGRNDRIVQALFRHLVGRVVIRVQNPVNLPPRSMLQPDVVLARSRQDFYESAHPTAEDIHLAVEVADSSLRLDRLVKLPIYARHHVREVWIVDLAAELVHVHRDPVDDVYHTVSAVGRGERISPVDFSDVELMVDELLG